MWRVVADYHTHTQYSHGKGTIRDNARAAQAQGLKVLGIADHGPANWGHGRPTCLADFDAIIAGARAVSAEFSGLRVLAGTEADIINYQGELDIPQELQRRLDQVLAGFHVTVFPKRLREGVRFASHWVLAKMSPNWRLRARAENTKAVVEAVYRNRINIITHPGLNISIDTPELARACVKRNTALEINTRHGIKSIAFIQAAAREGVRFVIGSDAHAPAEVGRLEAGVRAAQAGWTGSLPSLKRAGNLSRRS